MKMDDYLDWHRTETKRRHPMDKLNDQHRRQERTAQLAALVAITIIATVVLVVFTSPARGGGNPPNIECAEDGWAGDWYKIQHDAADEQNGPHTVTYTVTELTELEDSIQWATAGDVFRIVVKNGANTNDVAIVNPLTVPGNWSHVTFCFGTEVPPSSTTTTTIPSSTTITIPTTTTVPPPTTTTTVGTTTTTATEAPSTTTTTTVPSTTTSSPTSTTSMPDGTTSTSVPPTTTTTTPEPPTLPYTGIPTPLLAGLGVVVLATGGAILRWTKP